MFAKIETRKDALKTIKITSAVFFVAAAFSLALILGEALIPKQNVITDIVAGLFWLGLALWLSYGKSRTAAIFLLVFSVSNFVLLTLVALPILIGGMGDIHIHTAIGIAIYCLAVITVYAAIKAVEGTFKLHGRFKAT